AAGVIPKEPPPAKRYEGITGRRADGKPVLDEDDKRAKPLDLVRLEKGLEVQRLAKEKDDKNQGLRRQIAEANGQVQALQVAAALPGANPMRVAVLVSAAVPLRERVRALEGEVVPLTDEESAALLDEA